MVNIEEQKIKFYEKISAEQSKKGKNSRVLTREHYNQTVSRLKALENNMEPRVSSDSNIVRRFALLRVEVNGIVVEKLVKPGTNLRFIPLEDLFYVIHDLHLQKGHAGRDIMQKSVSSQYCNVTVEHINIYRSFCLTCGLKKTKGRRGVVVKPIKSSNVMSRAQVDLIDMQVN